MKLTNEQIKNLRDGYSRLANDTHVPLSVQQRNSDLRDAMDELLSWREANPAYLHMEVKA